MKETKTIPSVCGTSMGSSHQGKEERKAVTFSKDGSVPMGYQILSLNVSCSDSTFDSLVNGSVADIKWHTQSKGKDIKAIIAYGTIVSMDEDLACSNDSNTLRFILSDKNALKIKFASASGKLSIHPAE